ncbi:MAG: hypothetical protein AAFN74_24995, partial [Myxococcota bacterium]
MTDSSDIAVDDRVEVRAYPGARFFKCALQVNPRTYAARYQGAREAFESDEAYVDAVFEAAKAAGIEVLGIADHHNPDCTQLFTERAPPHIAVFPGFEATSSEGVHVLCLFEPGTPPGRLHQVLGQMRPSGADAPCQETFTAILRIVRERHGVAIAAHVHDDSGVLTKLDGQSRIDAWCAPDLIAAAVTKPVDDIEDRCSRDILKNRDHFHQRERMPALLFANDVKDPSDLLRNQRTQSLLKMSAPTIAGLRQAFLDPQSRVRLDVEHVDQAWPRIHRIGWTGGFFDGCELLLNENLNVLIGGRGAGKSASIESIRYVLGLDVHSSLQANHRGFVKEVLGGGTQVWLEVRTSGPTGAKYRIERTVSDQPVVKDAAGAVRMNIHPKDIFDIELLGQGELARIAEDPVARTSILQRFLAADPSHERQKQTLKERLRKSREQIASALQTLETDREAVAGLTGTRERLKHFDGHGLEERLEDRTKLGQEKHLFERAREQIEPLRAALIAIQTKLPLVTEAWTASSLEGLPAASDLVSVGEALNALSKALEVNMAASFDALQTADEGIANAQTAWSKRARRVDEAYQKLLRQLKAEGVSSADAFIELKETLQALEPRQAQIADQEQRLETLKQERANLLDAWQSLLAAEYRRLVKAAKKINKAVGRVRVQVRYRGNREPL